MGLTEQLWRSWSAAGEDLGIVVERLREGVVVRDFGRPSGTICATREDSLSLREEAEQQEMAFSILGASYLVYDRDLFIDTLNDWGWQSRRSPNVVHGRTLDTLGSASGTCSLSIGSRTLPTPVPPSGIPMPRACFRDPLLGRLQGARRPATRYWIPPPAVCSWLAVSCRAAS